MKHLKTFEQFVNESQINESELKVIRSFREPVLGVVKIYKEETSDRVTVGLAGNNTSDESDKRFRVYIYDGGAHQYSGYSLPLNYKTTGLLNYKDAEDIFNQAVSISKSNSGYKSWHIISKVKVNKFTNQMFEFISVLPGAPVQAVNEDKLDNELNTYLDRMHDDLKRKNYKRLYDDSKNLVDVLKHVIESANESNESGDVEYRGYQIKMKLNDKYKIQGESAYTCTVYKNEEYCMGIKGPVNYEKGIEEAKQFIDGTINRFKSTASDMRVVENSPALKASDVKLGDQVPVLGSAVVVDEIIKVVGDSIIEFKGSSEAGQFTYKYDDGSDEYIVI